MPLLYSVIARGTTILARYAVCPGNFAEVTEQILPKIAPNSKLTQSHLSYLYHHIAKDGVIYMCISDDMLERRRAFLFLDDVIARFEAKYGEVITTAIPFGMNEFASILSAQMKHFSECSEVDLKISQMQGQVSDVKEILVENIENIASRGEKLELLINKTENLNTSAVTFKSTSRTLAKKLWWKNVRVIIYVVIGLGVSIYILGAMACGVTWKACIS